MIIKGEIISVDYTANTYSVRLPDFESAGNSEQAIAVATASIPPGVYNGYKVGDAVFVGFETNSINKPIILGKLYLGVSSENNVNGGTANGTDLIISNSAKLPVNTTFGNTTMVDILNAINSNETFRQFNTAEYLRTNYILAKGLTDGTTTKTMTQILAGGGGGGGSISVATTGVTDLNTSVTYDANDKLSRIAGGTMENSITLAATEGLIFPGDAGFKTDAYGNFKHKQATTGDYWHLDKNDGTATFTHYWETGNTKITGNLQAAGLTNGSVTKTMTEVLNEVGGFRTYSYFVPNTPGTSTNLILPASTTTTGKIRFESISLQKFENSLHKFIFDSTNSLYIKQIEDESITQQIVSTSSPILLYQTGKYSQDKYDLYAYDRVNLINKTVERHCELILNTLLLNNWTGSWIGTIGGKLSIQLSRLAELNPNIIIPSISSYTDLNYVGDTDSYSNYTVEISGSYIRLTNNSASWTKAEWKKVFDGTASIPQITAFILKAKTITTDSSFQDKLTVNNTYTIPDVTKTYKVVTADISPIETVQISHVDTDATTYSKEQIDDKFVTNTTFEKHTTYSTSVQAVGTWIDGKTIYRKTYQKDISDIAGESNKNWSIAIDYADLGASQIWQDLTHTFIAGANSIYSLNSYNAPNGDFFNCYIDKVNKQICARGKTAGTFQDLYVTVEYTK